MNQRFENVEEANRNFKIGGYQVAKKWLQDRKGRVLSYDEICHYAKVLSALDETRRVMKEIEEIYNA